MSKTAAAMTTSTSPYTTPAFWERLWRSAGIQSVGLCIVAYVIYRYQPVIAVVITGFAVLNLMWFAAAIRATLVDAGQDGWGAAATASSAAFGGMFLLLVAELASGSGDPVWPTWVMTSFPRAMLIMSGSFGLWRARLISNGFFAAGVTAVVLVLLGGTTWMSDGLWSPDGTYSRFVSPAIGIVWVLVVSRILLARTPATRSGW